MAIAQRPLHGRCFRTHAPAVRRRRSGAPAPPRAARRTAAALLAAAALAGPGAALAAGATPPLEPAVEAVRRTLRAAREAVEGTGTRDEKLAGLREIARSLFDTDAMGRAAMGDTLLRQTGERQREFLDLWDEFIVRAYLQKLLFFRKPRFGYGKSEQHEDRTIVHTLIQTPKDEFYVDYEMRWSEARGWQATDIVVEGVSLTHNHGEQFKSLLRHESFDELLARLRRKVARHVREAGTEQAGEAEGEAEGEARAGTGAE